MPPQLCALKGGCWWLHRTLRLAVGNPMFHRSFNEKVRVSSGHGLSSDRPIRTYTVSAAQNHAHCGDCSASTALPTKEAPVALVTPRLSQSLTKAGYGIVGTHSAVKVCRWTKKQMQGQLKLLRQSVENVQAAPFLRHRVPPMYGNVYISGLCESVCFLLAPSYASGFPGFLSMVRSLDDT